MAIEYTKIQRKIITGPCNYEMVKNLLPSSSFNRDITLCPVS